MQHSRYNVHSEYESFRIFPKDEEGQVRPVRISRNQLILTHDSGVQVVFKKYIHRGNILWNDSRQRGSCSEQHVISELARMLFNGDTKEAKKMVEQVRL